MKEYSPGLGCCSLRWSRIAPASPNGVLQKGHKYDGPRETGVS